ncbi:MAG: four helix bundle protein [Bacteroidota bacterium]
MKEKREYNLEERTVNFAVVVLKLVGQLPSSYASNHLAKQITRSSTAPALLYGEAQAAESTDDFIHKMSVALKELRETSICLKIIYKSNFLTWEQVKRVVQENRELIAIFTASIETARKNKNSGKKGNRKM